MYKIAFYVPTSHVESVKNALFAKGAGKIGNYDCCAWQTIGTGQYRSLDGSNPYNGTIGTLETVEEYQVEMVCEDHLLHDILRELIRVHPYETPAYSAHKIIQLNEDQ